MNVIHLSTYDNVGGAAVSAFRLHKALRASNIESVFAVRFKHTRDDSVLQVQQANPVGDRFDTSAMIALQQYLIRQKDRAYKKLFSLPGPGLAVDELAAVKKADIVHLHWITEFISPVILQRLVHLNKPVIWTFHDQRPFTGGCHCVGDCSNFTKGCIECHVMPRDRYNLVNAVFQETIDLIRENINIVTPSKWLKRLVELSPYLDGCAIECIPNAVDLNVFRMKEKNRARHELGFPEKATVFVFGGGRLDDPVKGADQIKGAFRICLENPHFKERSQKGDILLATFGDNVRVFDSMEMPCRHFGYVTSGEKLRSIYAAADYFLLPSIEDNFPNTMIESICCGTPVIGYRTGGIPEVVVEGKTGILIEKGNREQFASALLKIAIGNEPSQLFADSIQRMAQRFALEKQAGKYLNLYEKVLSQKPTESSRRKVQDANPATADLSYELRERLRNRIQRILRDGTDDLSVPDAIIFKSVVQFDETDIERVVAQGKKTVLRIAMGIVDSVNALFDRLDPGEKSDAVNYVNRLLEQNGPEMMETFEDYFKLGLFFNRLNKSDEALMVYNKGLSCTFSNTQLSQLYFNRGLVLTKMARFEEALESHLRAVDLSSENALYHFHLGLSQKRLKNFHEALRSMGTAIHLAPMCFAYSIHKSIVLKDTGRYQEALAVIDSALESIPSSGDLHLQKGVILRELQLNEEALSALRDAERCGADMGEVMKFKKLVKEAIDIQGAGSKS